MQYDLFASTPRHVADLLATEAGGLGATGVRPRGAGVELVGSLETAYRLCLWSRVATRVVANLLRRSRDSQDVQREEVYQAALEIPWEEHLRPGTTFAVRASAAGLPRTNSHYVALVVKDAVADRFRERTGTRPDVDPRNPDLSISAHVSRTELTIGIDLSGDSLHRRGYRARNAPAPIKEHVAASLLLRAGWPGIAQAGGPLVDPMCGSGTIVIEGALMAADIAPGLVSGNRGPIGWAAHDAELWERLLEEATDRRANGLEHMPPIVGYDTDPSAVDATLRSALRAGLGERIRAYSRPLEDARPPTGEHYAPGLVAVNPPYGERLGPSDALPALYEQLGLVLSRRFSRWQAAILTAHERLSRATGLRARKVYALDNGPIACTLACFDLGPANVHRPPADRSARARTADTDETGGAAAFRNRLVKNLRRLRPIAGEQGVSCYRVYDADLPDYAVAIDCYEDRWVCLQEYAPPASIPRDKAERRLEAALEVTADVLGLSTDSVYLKQRKRQRQGGQYEKESDLAQLKEIREGELRFLVNFTDYLDVGIFLDGRLVRSRIRELAPGCRFVNLFCYSGTASVYAAAGGSQSTVSVDTSQTYLDWARRNMNLNTSSPGGDRMVRADCLPWLRSSTEVFDLIFLGPPTYSRGTGRDQDFDLQRDHLELLRLCAARLDPGGRIIFSTSFGGFRLDTEGLVDLVAEDVSSAVTPFDFQRSRGKRRTYEIRRR